MEEQLQEEELCNGQPMPSGEPPGGPGAYICGPNGWLWVPAG